MKKVGDWNQCRCGEAYQESLLTLREHRCEWCITYREQDEAMHKQIAVLWGCMYCGGDCCTIAYTGRCSALAQALKVPHGLIKIVMGL